MSEIIIDKAAMEATALLDILPKSEAELAGPYYLDGSCHLSGFICNATDEDTRKNAYISHGWSAAKISSEFQPGNGKDIRAMCACSQRAKTCWVAQSLCFAATKSWAAGRVSASRESHGGS